MRHRNLLRSVLVSFALVASLAGCAAISGQETPREYVHAATISTKVRAGIINQLGTTKISVETMNNIVQLSGFIEISQMKDRAEAVARGVTGVDDVRNDIIVRTGH